MDSAAGKTSWKRRGAEERAGTVGGKQDTTAPDSSCVPLLFQNQTMAAIVRSLPRPKTGGVLFRLCRIYLKTFPEYTGRRRRETRTGTKGEEKREISHDFFFFFLV